MALCMLKKKYKIQQHDHVHVVLNDKILNIKKTEKQ